MPTNVAPTISTSAAMPPPLVVTSLSSSQATTITSPHPGTTTLGKIEIVREPGPGPFNWTTTSIAFVPGLCDTVDLAPIARQFHVDISEVLVAHLFPFACAILPDPEDRFVAISVNTEIGMTAADDSAFDSRYDVLKPTPVPFGDDASKFFDGYSVRVGHRYLTLTACDFHVPGQIPVIQCRQLTEQLIGQLIQEFTTRPIVTTAWPAWASLDHGSNDQRLVDAVVATGDVTSPCTASHISAPMARCTDTWRAPMSLVSTDSLAIHSNSPPCWPTPASVCAAVGQVEAGQFAVGCNGKPPDTGESG